MTNKIDPATALTNSREIPRIFSNLGIDRDYLRANLEVVKGYYGTSMTLKGLETTQMGNYTTVSATGKTYDAAAAQFDNEVVEAEKSGSLMFTRGGRRPFSRSTNLLIPL